MILPSKIVIGLDLVVDPFATRSARVIGENVRSFPWLPSREPHAYTVGYRLRTECQPMTLDTVEDGGRQMVGEGKRVEGEGREILGRGGEVCVRGILEQGWKRSG